MVPFKNSNTDKWISSNIILGWTGYQHFSRAYILGLHMHHENYHSILHRLPLPLPIHVTPPLTSFFFFLLQNSRTGAYPARVQFPYHFEKLCIIKKERRLEGVPPWDSIPSLLLFTIFVYLPFSSLLPSFCFSLSPLTPLFSCSLNSFQMDLIQFE